MDTEKLMRSEEQTHLDGLSGHTAHLRENKHIMQHMNCYKTQWTRLMDEGTN